jgi:hypothetical protein
MLEEDSAEYMSDVYGFYRNKPISLTDFYRLRLGDFWPQAVFDVTLHRKRRWSETNTEPTKRTLKHLRRCFPAKTKNTEIRRPYFVNFDLLSKAFFICEFRVQDIDLRQHKN